MARVQEDLILGVHRPTSADESVVSPGRNSGLRAVTKPSTWNDVSSAATRCAMSLETFAGLIAEYRDLT